MKFLGRVRKKIGAKKIVKSTSETDRKVSYSEFSDVKTIGLVWDASDPSEFKAIASFHSKMKAIGKTVKVIGYHQKDELPDEYTAISYFNCLTKKDLNFFFLPVNSDADLFLKDEYDILIDANFENILPLQYITKLAKAGLKVGLYTEKNKDDFDVMIAQHNPKTSEYIEQVVYYLEMIHKDKQQ